MPHRRQQTCERWCFVCGVFPALWPFGCFQPPDESPRCEAWVQRLRKCLSHITVCFNIWKKGVYDSHVSSPTIIQRASFPSSWRCFSQARIFNDRPGLVSIYRRHRDDRLDELWTRERPEVEPGTSESLVPRSDTCTIRSVAMAIQAWVWKWNHSVHKSQTYYLKIFKMAVQLGRNTLRSKNMTEKNIHITGLKL